MTPISVTRSLLSVVLAALLLAAPILNSVRAAVPLPQNGSAANCKFSCKRKIVRHKAFLEIDANTGERLGGTTKFANGEDVQVIFVNKNPFKYHYRFQVTSSPLDQATAISFLKLIPGFGALIDQALGESVAATGLAPGGADCPGAAQPQWTALATKAEPLTQRSSELKTTLKQLADINEVYERFISETDRDSISSLGCNQVCDDAADLNQRLSKLTDLNDLPDKIAAFKEAVGAVQLLIAKFEVAFDALSTSQKDSCDVADKLKAFKALSGDSKVYADAVKKLQDNKKSFQQMATLIGDVLSSDDAFSEEQFPYTASGPTGVEIKIFRTNLRQENATEKQVGQAIVLQVGEPSLFLTAGIGFSTIGDRHIIRQAGMVPNGSGGTKLGTVFGFEQNSNFKPSGVFMLNAPFKRFKNDVSIGPSAGLVLSSRNNTVEPEFIAGLSVGLLRNTVFITGGFHAARMENLAPGFKFGQEVPADLKDPLPVEKSFKGGAMFSITYRIK